MQTKDQIRNRILRAAARMWGFQASEMDLEAFDPLVRLLLEATAGEVARLERLLADAEDRILDRMLEQLSPEVLTGPLPAHAVAQVRPLKPRLTVGPELEMYVTSEDKTVGQVHFAPIQPAEVVNASVAYLELGGRQLVRTGERRERVASGRPGQEFRGSTLWIGLELGQGVTSPAGMRFYFNWLNAPRLGAKLEWLRWARWRCGGRELRVRAGQEPAPAEDRPDIADFLAREYSRHQRSVAHIGSVYGPHLITVEGFAEGEAPPLGDLLTAYPSAIEAEYDRDALEDLTEPLLWFEVTFPTQFDPKDLEQTTCVVNPVLVANLRTHRQEARLQDTANIVALRTDHHYFDLLDVRSRRGTAYHEVPLTNVRAYAAGQYSVRRRDVGRFSEREASRAILNLLDALRDESAAFSAYGKDALDTKIKRLSQQLRDLEQQVRNAGADAMGSLAFLLVRPLEADRFLEVRYLSTQAERGNGYIAGHKLDLVKFAGVDRNGLRLVTSTGGGRAPLSNRDRRYAYKRAIISRGRVVSREDIRAFCEAEFGDALSRGGVEIAKEVVRGRGPRQGVERVMAVTLGLPAPRTPEEARRLDARIAALERELNRQSPGILPLRVRRGTPAQTESR